VNATYTKKNKFYSTYFKLVKIKGPSEPLEGGICYTHMEKKLRCAEDNLTNFYFPVIYEGRRFRLVFRNFSLQGHVLVFNAIKFHAFKNLIC
jgi:hypothetical protein